MLLAHLGDLHLGYRAYGRREQGRNARELDVERAFQSTVDQLIRLEPDVILVAGDLCDHPNPPPAALLALARGLETLRAALPDAPVLAVAGPRDTPVSLADPGPLATLDTLPGVEAATSAARSVHLEGLSAHALLVPHRALARAPQPALAPDPDFRCNILVIRGEPVDDGLELALQEWDYVALGGPHGHRRLAERAWVAGSLERVGSDPWAEAAEEKGFVTCDLESGEVCFHPVQGRPVVELAPTRVDPGHPSTINERIQEVVDGIPGGVDGKIVRLRIGGLAPEDQGLLDARYLARVRERALHLHVEVREEPWEVDGAIPAPPARPSPVARVEEWLRRVPSADAKVLSRAVDVARERLSQVGAADPGAAELEAVLDLNHPALGDASLVAPPGLVGLVAEDHRLRQALFEALDGSSHRVATLRGEPADTLQELALELARRMGLAQLDDALRSRARRSDAPGEKSGGVVAATRSGMRAELDRLGAKLRDVREAPRELRALEKDLTELRASAAEVTGDLEFRTMEWTRERQDAETQLQAYRDRARELKARLRQIETAGQEAICPTCGRPLADHMDEVLKTLREEWESVVQDGQWWKRRREQLDPKPEHLQELEGRSLRLHAAIEELTERLERRRAGLDDPVTLEEREAELRSLLDSLGGGASDEATPEDGGQGSAREDRDPAQPEEILVDRALEEVRRGLLVECREMLLRSAGAVLGRLSGGYFSGIVLTGDGLHLLQDGARVPIVSDADLAAAELALQLACVREASLLGHAPSQLVVGPVVDRLEGDGSGRAVDVLRSLAGSVRRILLVTAGGVVDRRPEVFDAALALRAREGSGRTEFTSLPVRPGGVMLS